MDDLIGFLENKNTYPFHMPGHKSNPDFLYGGLLSADITEIYGADNLSCPNGVLKNLQNRIAALFGAGGSYLLTNGSTCGIIAALLGVCGRGDTVVAARNAHRSFFSGLRLAGADAVYVTPPVTEHGFAGAIPPESVEAALRQTPNAKAVFITSPTYEGVVSDVAAISVIARKYNALLIIDEAHGAHFRFHKYFHALALDSGADIAVQSLHKTLPALTQTAVLHIRHGLGENIAAEIKRGINMIQTSSPSYMMMAQAAYMADMLERDAHKYFSSYVKRLHRFREQAAEFVNIRLLNRINTDWGKLVFVCPDYRGADLDTFLRSRGIQIEAAYSNYIIAMTSVADTSDGFNRLLAALSEADEIIRASGCPPPPSSAALTAGTPAADHIIPYPPGIPLVLAGELVTDEHIRKINEYTANGAYVSGV